MSDDPPHTILDPSVARVTLGVLAELELRWACLDNAARDWYHQTGVEVPVHLQEALEGYIVTLQRFEALYPSAVVPWTAVELRPYLREGNAGLALLMKRVCRGEKDLSCLMAPLALQDRLVLLTTQVREELQNAKGGAWRRPPAAGGDIPQEYLPKRNSMKVLQALANSRVLLTQEDLAGVLGLSDRTVRTCLQELRGKGLVTRPHGDKGGEAITPAGRALLPDP